MLKKLQFKSHKKLTMVIAFLLLLFVNNSFYAQCADTSSTGDCDGDGVQNSIDLDNDNDGILDTNECLNPETKKEIFTYTGADQSYTIPSNAISVTAKIWGAGGRGDERPDRGVGGAGGYTEITISKYNITNNTLILTVGQGGNSSTGSPTYGNGGAGSSGTVNNAIRNFGAGGGMSAISYATLNNPSSVTQADLIAIAGGAGSMPAYSNKKTRAGEGGGMIGGDATDAQTNINGLGGTQTTGGGSTNGNPGTFLQGGSSIINGSAGGGGYYGGGSGSFDNNQEGGGGGGSSYISSLTTDSQTVTSSTQIPAMSGDTDYISGVGVGGNNSAQNGGDGLIILIITLECDNDGDGIPNRLDSDSDNDGCSDADEAFYMALTNPGADTDNNGYYGSGIPTVDTNTGKVTASGAYAIKNTYYLDNTINTCDDNDNDGVTDYEDLDDDNDGILDTDEGYTKTAVPPACTGETILNFDSDYTEESGDGNIATFLEGEVFRFPNVASGIDALVTIIEFNNITSLPKLDDNVNGEPSAFQPQSSFSLTNIGDQAWTEYKFEFVEAGTTTPTIITKFFANFNDVDGGSNYGEQNWSQLPVDYVINDPTELTITHPGPWIVATAGYTEYPSVSNNYDKVNYTTEHTGSSYVIRLGAVARKAGVSGNRRQHQVEFACVNNYTKPDVVTILDTDEDGIPDHLDLDSDNDGCPDAVEAAGTYTYNDIDARYTRLTGTVNAVGIPNGTSQAIGTSTDKNIQSDICSPCDPANPKFQDFDGDGIGNICDNDDDNDGIPDGGKIFEYEKTTIVPGECTETQIEWLHNNATNDAGYDGQSDYATFDNTGSWRPGYSKLSSPNFTNADDIVFGAGLDETYNSSSTYIVGGVDKTTFEEAKTANDYVQVAYSPAVNMNLGLVRLGFSTSTTGADHLLNLGQFFVTLEMSTDPNFATSTVLYYDGYVDKIVAGEYLTLGHKYDIDLVAGTKYYYRFYTYNETNSYATNNVIRFDDVIFQHRTACQSDDDSMPSYRDTDSDNDGCPDALEGSGTYSHSDIDPVTGMLTAAVDNDKESATYGVPGGVTQTIGTSQNADVQSPACYISAYNDINQTPRDTPVNGALLTNDENISSVSTVTIGSITTNVTTDASGTTITNVPGTDKNGNPVLNAGTITIKSDGTYTFTPTAGFIGNINPITYTGEGTNGEEETAYLTIKVIPTILPGNNPPTAQNDVSTTEINTSINSTVLTNDSDPDGDNLTVSSADVTIAAITTVSGKDKD